MTHIMKLRQIEDESSGQYAQHQIGAILMMKYL